MLPLGPIQIFNFSNTVYYTKPSIFPLKTKFFRLDHAPELCHPPQPKRQQTAEYNVPYKVDTTRERDCLKC